MTTSTVYERIQAQAETIITTRQAAGENVPTNIKHFAGRKANWTVHLSEINVLPGLNFRDEDNFGDLDELRQQIRAAGGIMTAFTVIHVQGQLFAVNGHRRYEAGSAFIGTDEEHLIEKVEVKLLDKNATDRDIAVRQVHDNSSEAYSEWSKANAVDYYSRTLGMSNVEISDVTGWPKSRVSDLITLGTLNINEKTFVKAQGVSPASAIQAVRELRKLSKELDQHITLKNILEVSLHLAGGKNVSRALVKQAADSYRETVAEATAELEPVTGFAAQAAPTETVTTQAVTTESYSPPIVPAAEPTADFSEMIETIEAFDGWRSMDRDKLARIYRYVTSTVTDAQPLAKSNAAALSLPTELTD